MTSIQLEIGEMTCHHCARTVEESIRSIPGAKGGSVDCGWSRSGACRGSVYESQFLDSSQRLLTGEDPDAAQELRFLYFALRCAGLLITVAAGGSGAVFCHQVRSAVAGSTVPLASPGV